LVLFPDYARYKTPAGVTATQEYVSLARKANLKPAQMALAFVNSRSFVTSNIIGSTTLAQLDENLASADVSLSNDLLEEIESIHQQNSNPCP